MKTNRFFRDKKEEKTEKSMTNGNPMTDHTDRENG
jgi:hypothetical protein